MHYQTTTGLDPDDMTELVARIHDILACRGTDLKGYRLGLYRQVELALVLLRQDMVQMCAADLYGVSQPTVSRIWRRILPLLDEVLAFDGISLQEAVAQGEPILVDGAFIPTGNRPASGQGSANYSGKHHVQCLNIQVAGTLSGDLIATSQPVPGSRHDSAAIQMCGWQEILEDAQVCWIADTAYIATTAITPITKTPDATASSGRNSSITTSPVCVRPLNTSSDTSQAGRFSTWDTGAGSRNSPKSSESSPGSNSTESAGNHS